MLLITFFIIAGNSLILIIADGFGISQLGWMYLNGWKNIVEVMNQGKVGLVNTSSIDKLVTDSAAAATAMACGIKTKNGYIGMDENGMRVKNIFELSANRYIRAVITTDRLTGATPSAFISHAKGRWLKDEIINGILEGNFEYIIGGGRNDFMEAPGFNFSNKLKLIKGKKNIITLFDEEFPYYRARKITLSDIFLELYKLIKSDDFIVVIEAARIDHAAHANDAQNLLYELKELDDLIGVCKKIVDEKENTLLLITADHDTAAFSFTKKDEEYPSHEELPLPKAYFVSKQHTHSPVILIGYGKNKELINSFQENTHIFEIMKKHIGVN